MHCLNCLNESHLSSRVVCWSMCTGHGRNGSLSSIPLLLEESLIGCLCPLNSQHARCPEGTGSWRMAPTYIWIQNLLRSSECQFLQLSQGLSRGRRRKMGRRRHHSDHSRSYCDSKKERSIDPVAGPWRKPPRADIGAGDTSCKTF